MARTRERVNPVPVFIEVSRPDAAYSYVERRAPGRARFEGYIRREAAAELRAIPERV